MLKKKNRLKKIKGASGKTINTPLFSLKISQSGEKETKFGFVVSKKISKKAVLRNKTKRVLQEAARGALEKVASGKNIIIYAKKNFTYKDTEEVKKNILDNLK
ncbi:MAG TPA: ribonuclease P protein component [Candidatus Sulfotelmatobacter sp.]|nr:ribonuclease P protein component [Candidatus Sulfotelmatobacter sp.]